MKKLIVVLSILLLAAVSRADGLVTSIGSNYQHRNLPGDSPTNFVSYEMLWHTGQYYFGGGYAPFKNSQLFKAGADLTDRFAIIGSIGQVDNVVAIENNSYTYRNGVPISHTYSVDYTTERIIERSVGLLYKQGRLRLGADVYTTGKLGLKLGWSFF